MAKDKNIYRAKHIDDTVYIFTEGGMEPVEICKARTAMAAAVITDAINTANREGKFPISLALE